RDPDAPARGLAGRRPPGGRARQLLPIGGGALPKRSPPEIPPARRRACRRRRTAAFAVALLCTSASAASAGEDGLVYDWKVDGAVTAAALAFWGGTQLFESSLAPASCRWCEPGA